MPFTEDLDPIFADYDIFATSATVAGSTVYGILNEDWVEAQGVEGYKPIFKCRASDVSSVDRGDAVTVGSQGYTVQVIDKEDQQGLGTWNLILEKDDGQADATWAEVDSFTLGSGNDIVNIVNILTKIAVTSTLNDNIEAGVYDTDNAYRLTTVSAYGEFDAAQISTMSLAEITTSGLDIIHDIGESAAGFSDQILGTQSWLEGLIGARVDTLAYPTHRHDRLTQEYLRNNGYLAARDGQCENVEGVGHYLTTAYTNQNIIKSWEMLPVFSIPTQRYFSQAHIKNLSTKQEIYDFLYDTANNQSSPTTSYLYGAYTSLMEQWKANYTFSPFYMHNELSADQLTWLLEIMTEDSDVWVDSFGEIMRYAKLRHKPSDSDDLVWEPRTGFGASDLSNLPWNGHKMAFAFTTDDGREENYTSYLGICQALGINFTAFVMDDGESALSDAQIIALHDSGYCEIGNHANNASRLIREECCTLTHKGTATRIAVEVTEDGGTRSMTFYSSS